MQLEFLTLKEKVSTALVLVYPNFNEPSVMELDSSEKEIGTVLVQKKDDGY